MSTQIENLQSQLVDGIKQNFGSAVAIGVLSVIMGLLAIMAPGIAGLSVTIVVGVLLSVNGVSQLIFAFKTGAFGNGLLTFVLGALATGIGFYMMFNSGLGLLSLTLFLAVYFFVAGISEIIGAWQMRPVKGWVWALISGIWVIAIGRGVRGAAAEVQGAV